MTQASIWPANIWQDIDTVPIEDERIVFLSDGTTVVAARWYENANPRYPRTGWVLAGGDDMGGVFDLLDSGYYDWFAPTDFTPTHWAPMLELPGV